MRVVIEFMSSHELFILVENLEKMGVQVHLQLLRQASLKRKEKEQDQVSYSIMLLEVAFFFILNISAATVATAVETIAESRDERVTAIIGSGNIDAFELFEEDSSSDEEKSDDCGEDEDQNGAEELEEEYRNIVQI